MSCDRRELKVYPPVLRWGVLGRWVRDQLQAGILRGTPVLLRIQSLRTPALNTAMKVELVYVIDKRDVMHTNY